MVTESCVLRDVVGVADEKRDATWENNFFHALAGGSLKVLVPDPQIGPDGWPYLLVESEGMDAEMDSFQKILLWLTEKGVGLVVNSQKEFPDYVFTYGMLWNFKESGLFFKKSEASKEGFFEFQIKDIRLAGDPSVAYLPAYVRRVLKEFLLQQGVLNPKILALTFDETHFELAFSKESLGNPDPSEHQGLLEALAWFFPLHYRLSLISEKELTIPFATL